MDFVVDGMTCEHCVHAVTAAVRSVAGVSGVTVDLAAGQVHVEGQPNLGAVKTAIEQAGYSVA